ncbi:hypothetical protein RJ639_021754 [Escallonia herrerae]|uniref:Uncharacterized protein n=1 Tax=Escallonia herrerae TaxID=1293975 RepID=A0AA88V6R0_9ASTE|nr:hypothetical protein RJ639_021754 [Escallonia herrerae]
MTNSEAHHIENKHETETETENKKGGQAACSLQLYRPLCARACVSLKARPSEFSRRHFVLSSRSFCFKADKIFSTCLSNQCRSDNACIKATSAESLSHELTERDDGSCVNISDDATNYSTLQFRPKMFKNRFLNFVRLSTVFNTAAESFFKSEIRRRLFVTAFLIVISRIGYFIPLPGFDRRLIPENYLSFVSGSVDELGDFAPELKLSLFQLGISPQIAASILMQGKACDVDDVSIGLRCNDYDMDL